jgi:large subunit ribosomal protein L25
MAETIELSATPREQIGKASRKLAQVGKVPAVLYGAGHKPEPLELDVHELERLLHHEGLRSLILHVKIEGTAKPVNAMVKAVQVDPTKGRPLHVDLLAIKMNVAVTTTVALHFEGESPGVKGGGVLNQSLTSVNVEALPTDLPESIVVDISELDIGHNLMVSDLVAPAGATILDDPEILVASVTAPTKAEEEVVEVEEGAEPAIVGEEPVEEESGE